MCLLALSPFHVHRKTSALKASCTSSARGAQALLGGCKLFLLPGLCLTVMFGAMTVPSGLFSITLRL